MMKYYILLLINLLCLVLVPFFMFQFKDEIRTFFIDSCLKTPSNDTAISGINNFHVPTTSTELPRNCEDIQKIAHRILQNAPSGVYKIYLESGDNRIVEVYCDMLTDNGGWLVIQRRSENDSQVDFYRSWNQYAKGFGNLEKSHWLGLDTMFALTNSDKYELRIDLMDMDGEKRYAKYTTFRIDNATELYRLHVGGYVGNATDSLWYHDGKPFTTKDRDNDNHATLNCANHGHGAWWYGACHMSNLNGLYGSMVEGPAISWRYWKGDNYSMKRTEMKIRTLEYEQILL